MATLNLNGPLAINMNVGDLVRFVRVAAGLQDVHADRRRAGAREGVDPDPAESSGGARYYRDLTVQSSVSWHRRR